MSSYLGKGSWRIGPEREWCLLTEDEMNDWGNWWEEFLNQLIDNNEDRESFSWNTTKLLEQNRTPQLPDQQEPVV